MIEPNKMKLSFSNLDRICAVFILFCNNNNNNHNNEIKQNIQLAEELHKPIIRKF